MGRVGEAPYLKHAGRHATAARLARTYRWGGESCWDWPLSVAQHSLLVLALRRQASPQPLSPQDAEEGFLGFDCISPLKRVLGQPFLDVGNRLLQAVRDVLQIDDPVPTDDPLVERCGGVPWQPWPSDLAGRRFLGQLQALVARR